MALVACFFKLGVPTLSFAVSPSLKNLIQYFQDEIYDGDVILHNDVYTGNQNNDWGIYKPIFHQGNLLAWTVAKGHMADTGGGTAGGYNPIVSGSGKNRSELPL